MKLNEISSNPHAEIEVLLKRYRIKNYTIQPDGTVDVNGSVYLYNNGFVNIPIKFGKILGDFSCTGQRNLISLAGSPNYVAGDFNCIECSVLQSIRNSPAFIGGRLDCSDCPNLISFEGFQSTVGNTIYCTWQNIKSGGIGILLSGCKQIYIYGAAYAAPFDIIAKYLGRPEDIFECQAELIEAGYEEFAQL